MARSVLAVLLFGLLASGVMGTGCGRSSDVVGGTATGGSGGSVDKGDLDFEACAEVTDEATFVPVNMYVLVDKSGSMEMDFKWDDTEAAFTAFFEEPEAAAMNVALRFWPKDGCNDPDPDDDDTTCDPTPCSMPEVGLGSLGDTAQRDALVDAFAQTEPSGGTPMSAALEGGVLWAQDLMASAPEEKYVILLVSDGQPHGCVEDPVQIAQIATDAWMNDGILTYAVGLAGSAEALMNAIAEEGGTTSAFFIGSGNVEQDLLDALLEIAGESVSCSFPVPEPESGDTLDPELVRVEYASGDSSLTSVPQVGGEADCGSEGGFYYDDPDAPTTITLCSSTCSEVQSDDQARVDVALGCECEVDADCPGDNICVAGSCIEPCTTDADCPAQHICIAGRCVPEEGDPCQSDEECDFGLVCIGGQCSRGGVVVGRQEAVQGGAFSCATAPRRGPWGALGGALVALGLLVRRRRIRA